MTKSLVLPIRELVSTQKKSFKSPERNSTRVMSIVRKQHAEERKKNC